MLVNYLKSEEEQKHDDAVVEGYLLAREEQEINKEISEREKKLKNQYGNMPQSIGSSYSLKEWWHDYMYGVYTPITFVEDICMLAALNIFAIPLFIYRGKLKKAKKQVEEWKRLEEEGRQNRN